MLIARFDGACQPINPGGHAACACLIERDGVEVYRKSEYIGHGDGMTNNVAEYRGLLLILNWFNSQPNNERIHIIGDSQIVIRRMSGKARKPSTGVCSAVSLECLNAAVLHRFSISYEWQRREHNDECDAMCQLEIDEIIAQLEERYA